MDGVSIMVLELLRQGFRGGSDRLKGWEPLRWMLSPLFNCQPLDTNHSESPASAPSAKAGL